MSSTNPEAWEISLQCWLPVLTRTEIETLAEGLECNDARLIQKKTVLPRPSYIDDRMAMCGCAITFARWVSRGPVRALEAEELFNQALNIAIDHFATNADPGLFLSWYDENPWNEVRPKLLAKLKEHLEKA